MRSLFNKVIGFVLALFFKEEGFPYPFKKPFVPRPAANVGSWKTYSPLNRATGNHQTISVFLEKQGAYDKSYHHRDLGVPISGFSGSVCRKLPWAKRLKYIGSHIGVKGLPSILTALDNHCKDPNTELIEGKVYIGVNDLFGTDALFMYNQKNKKLVFFHADSKYLWSYWTANLTQHNDLINNRSLHLNSF